ncbi:hypothetical protein C7271_12650 [filamentous cyanobacterium CCP5]|nr:hypothetical protein C7271_12650 [filamentous cyanobacterium CCP5]
MDIPIGARVDCTDGPCGQSSHVLINPISQTITHVVVYDSHWLSSTSRMVPFEQILETTPDTIRLGCSRDDVHKMDDFIQLHSLENAFYDADRAAINHPMLAHSWWPGDSEAYLLWPYVTPDESSLYISMSQEQIPPIPGDDGQSTMPSIARPEKKQWPAPTSQTLAWCVGYSQPE